MTALTITQGGVYEGEFSLITLQTLEPVTVRGKLTNLSDRGYLFDCYHSLPGSGWDLTVEHLTVEGVDAWDSPRWFVGQNWKRLLIRNCTITNTRGIELWPNAYPNPVTEITRNRHMNIKGTTQGNSLGDVGNFVQFRVIGQATPLEVSWNEIVNEYGKSNPEDIISIFKTAHTRVHDNMLWHHSKPPNFSGSSQNGVTIDPAGEPNLLFDNLVQQNQLVEGYSIGMFGGNNNSFEDNRIVADGYWTLPGGGRTPMLYGYEGIYIASGFQGNSAKGNIVGYVGAQGRQDGRVPDWSQNTHMPSPIDQTDKDAEWAYWQQKIRNAGVTIGAGGTVTDLPLTKISETQTKITLGWTPVQGAIGYRFQSSSTQPKYSHTWDASRSQVTFSKAAWYTVEALAVEASGKYPPSAPTYLLDDQFSTFNSDVWQKYWFWGHLADSYWHYPSGEAQAYRPANCFVDANGVLNLVAKRESVTDFQGRPREYTSGMIQSNGIDDGVNSIPVGFSFTYGLIEARIKVAHAGVGIWDGFWLCTAGHPSSCSTGEIDIFEVIGTEPNTLQMNYHRTDMGINSGSAWVAPAPLGDDYHVYAVDWRPTYIAWLCDGVEHFRYTGPGIPNDPHYIIVTHVVAESGGWGGAPNAQTVFPNTMFVDWVRVAA